MHSGFPALAALLLVTAGATQAGEANICRELASYVDGAIKEGPQGTTEPRGKAGPAGKAGPDPGDVRREGEGSGTQGGGSVNSKSSSNVRQQPDAPPNAPASNSSAPEPASSPHASSNSTPLGGNEPWRQPEYLQAVARRGDIAACRKATQDLRRGGVQLPAALIALAAYTRKAGQAKE